MASVLDYITQGTRIVLTSYKNRFFQHKYQGKANEICTEIVKDCWNKQFFQTSTQNFSQFWTRDFGWCTSSLLKLKYQKEVQQTLRYALNRFKKYNKITTTITPSGKPFDFPDNGVDSLPWLIHSIKLSKFEYYEHKDFLNQQIRIFFNKVIDKNTGLVNNKPYSSMKDFTHRNSSCYDNCMVAMLAKDLAQMKRLDNPFKKYDYYLLIKQNFWNGKYFYDDLEKHDYVAGDANIFPFIIGLYNDQEMLKSVIEQIKVAELDSPLPLKYTHSRENIKFIWQEFFLKDYESNSVWTHMGPLYIKMVEQVDKNLAKHYKEQYTEMIEKHQNYLEVFDFEGKPYKTPFYYTAPGMLWAANYLTL